MIYGDEARRSGIGKAFPRHPSSRKKKYPHLLDYFVQIIELCKITASNVQKDRT